jgi:hypothetical protein
VKNTNVMARMHGGDVGNPQFFDTLLSVGSQMYLNKVSLGEDERGKVESSLVCIGRF